MSQTRARLAVSPPPLPVFIPISSLLPLHIQRADIENNIVFFVFFFFHLTLGKEANECTFKMSNFSLNM